LLVRGENLGVRAFYEKLGYRLVDTVLLQKALEQGVARPLTGP
jgi:hypothetical protein